MSLEDPAAGLSSNQIDAWACASLTRRTALSARRTRKRHRREARQCNGRIREARTCKGRSREAREWKRRRWREARKCEGRSREARKRKGRNQKARVCKRQSREAREFKQQNREARECQVRPAARTLLPLFLLGTTGCSSSGNRRAAQSRPSLARTRFHPRARTCSSPAPSPYSSPVAQRKENDEKQQKQNKQTNKQNDQCFSSGGSPSSKNPLDGLQGMDPMAARQGARGHATTVSRSPQRRALANASAILTGGHNIVLGHLVPSPRHMIH